MGDDANHHGSAAQYVEVDDEVVRIVDKTLVDQNRFLVAVVGPPGAGKSTTCNTLYHIAFGSKASFFEPSANPTSFTKGLWLLSKEARKNLPADSTWECVDMEGFQVDLMSSWKMAMVLCVLSEICIFCNRDARCDNLFKAATVFERGRKLALQLGMKPITKQIFVQVEEGMEKDQEALVVSKIEEMVPNLKIIPFEIPQIRNKNKKNHEFITFHEEIVEAVKAGLVDKFVFSATEDTAASKTEAVSQLLNAFNEGDYLKSTDMNTELLRADLERIYESELAVIKNTHVSKALKTPVTSTEMTLEEFIGGPVEFKPDYKSSTFYVEGKNDKFLEDWILTQPDFDYRKIYNSYYTDKMAELVAERERELMLQVQKEKDYHADLQRAIEVAKFNLQRHLGTLSFSMSLTKNPDEFIESKKIMEERGVEFKHTVSWDPFYKFYEHEKLCIKGMWDAQVNKAKWKCPVSSQGKLKCKNGHKINEDIVLCTAQIAPDAKGNTKCGGTWYWVDGPLKFAKCRGACGQVQKLPSNVSCFKCGAEAQCEIRPSNYFPG